MNPHSAVNEIPIAIDTAIDIDAIDRWNVYHRLQQLSIPCWCQSGQPLQVRVNSVASAVQLWGVIRRVTASRPECIHWLHRCWQLSSQSVPDY
jgi:hypothetical protein